MWPSFSPQSKKTHTPLFTNAPPQKWSEYVLLGGSWLVSSLIIGIIGLVIWLVGVINLLSPHDPPSGSSIYYDGGGLGGGDLKPANYHPRVFRYKKMGGYWSKFPIIRGPIFRFPL